MPRTLGASELATEAKGKKIMVCIASNSKTTNLFSIISKKEFNALISDMRRTNSTAQISDNNKDYISIFSIDRK